MTAHSTASRDGGATDGTASEDPLANDTVATGTGRAKGAITLRAAREADVRALVELVQRAYRGEGGWTTEAHLVDGQRTDESEVRAMLTDPAVTLLVAEDSPEHAADAEPSALLGCCYTHRESPDETGTVRAELGLFAVDPGAQGRGLGGRLLEAQASHLATEGVDVLMIRVLQSRPELHAWYERHGFTATGHSVPFAGNVDWLKVEGLGMDVMERPLPTA